MARRTFLVNGHGLGQYCVGDHVGSPFPSLVAPLQGHELGGRAVAEDASQYLLSSLGARGIAFASLPSTSSPGGSSLLPLGQTVGSFP